MKNWIADTNRFKLATPPKWWLKRLWDFDASLVLMPSRQKMLYRLTQRHEPDPRIAMVAASMWRDSDTQMMSSYQVVPVLTLLLPVKWDNPMMFHDLSLHAPWRHGGTDKFLAKIEGAEAEAETKRDARVEDMMDERHKDAWKLFRRRQGLGRSWHHQQTPLITPRTS